VAALLLQTVIYSRNSAKACQKVIAPEVKITGIFTSVPELYFTKANQLKAQLPAV